VLLAVQVVAMSALVKVLPRLVSQQPVEFLFFVLCCSVLHYFQFQVVAWHACQEQNCPLQQLLVNIADILGLSRR
jgi:hypothetical protein